MHFYGDPEADVKDPNRILHNLSAIGAPPAGMQRVSASVTWTADQAAAIATIVGGSVCILGAGPVGVAVVDALLARRWPHRLIELVGENPGGVPVRVSQRLGGARRARVLVVATSLDDVAKVVKRVGNKRLVISCVAGVPKPKQLATLRAKYFLRTRISLDGSSERLSTDEATEIANTCAAFYRDVLGEELTCHPDEDVLANATFGEDNPEMRVAPCPAPNLNLMNDDDEEEEDDEDEDHEHSDESELRGELADVEAPR